MNAITLFKSRSAASKNLHDAASNVSDSETLGCDTSLDSLATLTVSSDGNVKSSDDADTDGKAVDESADDIDADSGIKDLAASNGTSQSESHKVITPRPKKRNRNGRKRHK